MRVIRWKASLALAIVTLSGGGCEPGILSLEGRVFSGPDSVVGLDGAKLIVRDQDGDLFTSTRSDSDGNFSLDAPMGTEIFMEVRHDDLRYRFYDPSPTNRPTALMSDESVPAASVTSFNGRSGLSEVFRVEDGLLYGLPGVERRDWEVLFVGCPAIGELGTVLGEVRVAYWEANGESPLVTTGFVWLESAEDGTRYDACYLDPVGLGYDATAERTGASGKFAIFGVPEGRYLITIGYNPFSGASLLTSHQVWIADGGVTPLLPAWVELYL